MDILHKLKIISFCFVVLFFLESLASGAADFKKHDFTITLPGGWEEIPVDDIIVKSKEMADVFPDVPGHCFDHAFRLASSGPVKKYPLVYVKINRKGRIAQNRLNNLQQHSLADDIDKCIRDLSNMKAGQKIYDKTNNVIWMRLDGENANKEQVSGLSGLILTETGFIQVTGYSRRKDFDAYVSVFQAAVLSVVPAPGLVYKPRLSDRLPAAITSMHWGYVCGDSLLHIAIALGAGIIGTVVIARSRKR